MKRASLWAGHVNRPGTQLRRSKALPQLPRRDKPAGQEPETRAPSWPLRRVVSRIRLSPESLQVGLGCGQSPWAPQRETLVWRLGPALYFKSHQFKQLCQPPSGRSEMCNPRALRPLPLRDGVLRPQPHSGMNWSHPKGLVPPSRGAGALCRARGEQRQSRVLPGISPAGAMGPYFSCYQLWPVERLPV